MTASILGRERELDAIDRFLAAPAPAGVLVISGPAGIGKTTLWEWGIVRARDRGYQVVVSRPSQTETGLAFGALNDLFGEIVDEALPTLPEPQRIALEVALLRTSSATAPSPLAVALGALGTVRAAAAKAPLLIGVDDVQWLDDPSARVLEFVLRRLERNDARLLAAERREGTGAVLGALGSFAHGPMAVLEPRSLSIDAIARLLHVRLGLNLSRPLATRIHRLSGGSPFYALELGRALHARGSAGGDADVDVLGSLDELVADRIAALDAEAGEVTLFASALSQPTVRVLRAAVEHGGVTEALARAVEAGVLSVHGEDVAFTHPLLAAAAYARGGDHRRRSVHARLATVLAEPEEVAEHLARATIEPDADVAGRLEQAADVARGRGAPESAARLRERAAELSTDDDPDGRRRRLFAAAEDHVAAGDQERAYTILDGLAASTPDGPARAEVLARLAQLMLHAGRFHDAQPLYERALRLARDDPRTRIPIELGLAAVGWLAWRAWRSRVRHAENALALALELGDERVLLETIGKAATWRHMRGKDWRSLLPLADGVREWGTIAAVEHADHEFMRLLAQEGDVAPARERLARLRAHADALGDWYSIPRLLMWEAELEFLVGDWARAVVLLADARTGLLQSGQGTWQNHAASLEYAIHGARGDVEAAASAREEVLGSARPEERWVHWRLALTGGELELSQGRFDAAADVLCPLLARPSPGLLPASREAAAAGLAIEALVGLGRADEARRLLGPFERRACRSGDPFAVAIAARSRSLVLAALGEVAAAAEAAREAVRAAEATPSQFLVGRALLAAGEVYRRARSKPESRAALERAVATFDRLPARLWAERARGDLARVAPRRATRSALTETERRVAELAAAGNTNREVADALFMSVHTVEAHLTRVFRALGVQNRTELARAWPDAADQPGRSEAADGG